MRVLGVIAAAVLGVSAQSATAAGCAPKGAEPSDAVRRMYAGAMAGDRAATLAEFAPKAQLFDGGVRFTPEALVEVILKAEAGGTKPTWRISGVEAHVSCDMAWATWNTDGVFTTDKGAEPKDWLESAVFVWRNGAWKIRFFHSTPIAPRSQKSPAT